MKVKSRDTGEYFNVYYNEHNGNYDLHGAIRGTALDNKSLKRYIENGELEVIEDKYNLQEKL